MAAAWRASPRVVGGLEVRRGSSAASAQPASSFWNSEPWGSHLGMARPSFGVRTLAKLILNAALVYALQQALSGVRSPAISTVQPKFVYIGSVNSGYANLATAATVPELLNAGGVGLYQHANGNSSLTATQREVLWKTWSHTGVTTTGQGQSVGEVGGV